MSTQTLKNTPEPEIPEIWQILELNENQAIRTFKYVRHEDREAYERDGWIFAADLGPTHGYYAVLMEKIEPTS